MMYVLHRYGPFSLLNMGISGEIKKNVKVDTHYPCHSHTYTHTKAGSTLSGNLSLETNQDPPA